MRDDEIVNPMDINISLDAGDIFVSECEIEELKIHLVKCIDEFNKDTNINLDRIEVFHWKLLVIIIGKQLYLKILV